MCTSIAIIVEALEILDLQSFEETKLVVHQFDNGAL
jgi:hypothetical protein